MPLLIPVGFGQAVYEFRLEGDEEPMVTTLGHDLSNVDGGDYGEIADRLMTSFGTLCATRINNNYDLTSVSLYVGQDGGPPAVFESALTAIPMTGTGEPVPQNTAFLVRKRTSRAGRRGRGRMYIPGVPEASVGTTGNVAGAVVTAWTTALNAWMATLQGEGAGEVAYPPVILHRSEGNSVPGPPTPVTAFTMDPIVATQRQRLRR